jgi:hypothetical protein
MVTRRRPRRSHEPRRHITRHPCRGPRVGTVKSPKKGKNGNRFVPPSKHKKVCIKKHVDFGAVVSLRQIQLYLEL